MGGQKGKQNRNAEKNRANKERPHGCLSIGNIPFWVSVSLCGIWVIVFGLPKIPATLSQDTFALSQLKQSLFLAIHDREQDSTEEVLLSSL